MYCFTLAAGSEGFITEAHLPCFNTNTVPGNPKTDAHTVLITHILTHRWQNHHHSDVRFSPANILVPSC